MGIGDWGLGIGDWGKDAGSRPAELRSIGLAVQVSEISV